MVFATSLTLTLGVTIYLQQAIPNNNFYISIYS